MADLTKGETPERRAAIFGKVVMVMYVVFCFVNAAWHGSAGVGRPGSSETVAGDNLKCPIALHFQCQTRVNGMPRGTVYCNSLLFLLHVDFFP